jgi:DNA ligase-1
LPRFSYRSRSWFTAKLPAPRLDGELWLAGGKFDELSGIVLKLQAVDAEWQRVKYMVFELPAGDSTFDQRSQKLQALVQQAS